MALRVHEADCIVEPVEQSLVFAERMMRLRVD
jgi:hypothetical protein